MTQPTDLDRLAAAHAAATADTALISKLRNPHGHSQIVMRLSAADRLEALIAELRQLRAVEAERLIETCEYGHKFVKLPDHPRTDMGARCPYCMSIGLDAARAERDRLREALGFMLQSKFRSLDRDNMEFEARFTCFQLDKARAALGGEQ